MNVNGILLILTTLIMTLISYYVFDHVIIGAIVGFFTGLILSIIFTLVYFNNKMRKWLKILVVDRDPIAYIKKGNDLINNKNYIQFSIKINQSAGLIEYGDFEQAKAMLLSIDQNVNELKHPINKLAYYSNLLTCHLNLNQLDEAAKIFNENLQPIQISNQKLLDAKKYVESIYLFYQGQYEECKQCLESVKSNNINNNIYLHRLYYLALIDVKQGLVETAKEKLHEIVQKRYPLYIVQQAKLQLDQLNQIV